MSLHLEAPVQSMSGHDHRGGLGLGPTSSCWSPCLPETSSRLQRPSEKRSTCQRYTRKIVSKSHASKRREVCTSLHGTGFDTSVRAFYTSGCMEKPAEGFSQMQFAVFPKCIHRYWQMYNSSFKNIRKHVTEHSVCQKLLCAHREQ